MSYLGQVARRAALAAALMAPGVAPAHPTVERQVATMERPSDDSRWLRRNRDNKKLRQRLNRARKQPWLRFGGRKRRPHAPELSREQAIIHRMTNWQRNQWARAGYPKDERLLEFAEMGRQRPACYYEGR